MAYIYILATQHNKMVYIGTTNNLIRRIYEHKHGLVDGFTQKFNIKKLVYYEQHPTMLHAIKREKVLKEWKRVWKDHLISTFNPTWRDLYEDICI